MTVPARVDHATVATMLKAFAEGTLVETLAIIVSQIRKEVAEKYETRIKELETRNAELATFTYRGVWQAASTYQRGNFVTFDGSIWHCNRDDTRSKPPTDDWQLAVRAGRDLRDPSTPRVPTAGTRRQHDHHR